MIWSIALISIIFLLNIIWLMWRREQRRPSQIRGIPPSDPELGNLGDIGRAGSLHQFLTQLHRQFGPVTWFQWGKTPVVSIASIEAFQQIRRLFDRPPMLFSAFEPLLGSNSIQYANGDVGRYRRKHHYEAALSANALRSDFIEIFQQVLREKLSQWKSAEQNQSIALHSEMLKLAMRSITLAAFGSAMSTDEEVNIAKAYDVCWHEMEMRIQGEPADSKRQSAFEEARSVFSRKVNEIVSQRREGLGRDRRCFIDYLLEDTENVTSEEHICDEVITMLVGGFHTTGNLVTWTLYYLARDELAQERLFDELKQTYQTEFPSIEQIDQMSYLTNVINEALRVSVLAPWAARVSYDADIVVCGHRIPAGTPIIQALGVMLQDETIWRNPKEFIPDRFQQENKKDLGSLAFSPFGFAGKRACPGSRFAHYETALFLSGIIRAFKVKLTDPKLPVIPVHGLVTAPKDEIYVHLELREH